jgi:hypothetical protein
MGLRGGFAQLGSAGPIWHLSFPGMQKLDGFIYRQAAKCAKD